MPFLSNGPEQWTKLENLVRHQIPLAHPGPNLAIQGK